MENSIHFASIPSSKQFIGGSNSPYAAYKAAQSYFSAATTEGMKSTETYSQSLIGPMVNFIQTCGQHYYSSNDEAQLEMNKALYYSIPEQPATDLTFKIDMGWHVGGVGEGGVFKFSDDLKKGITPIGASISPQFHNRGYAGMTLPHMAETIKRFAAYIAGIEGVNPTLFTKFLFERCFAYFELAKLFHVASKGCREYFGFTLGTNARFVDPKYAVGYTGRKLKRHNPTSYSQFTM